MSAVETSQDEADAEEGVSYEDACEVGLKVIEMADRVRVGHAVLPGSQAKWCFEIDGQRYDVTVTVAPPAA